MFKKQKKKKKEKNKQTKIKQGGLSVNVDKLALFPDSSEVEVRLFIFFQKRTDFFFSIFKVRIFISKKCQTPHQNQMVVP